MLPDIINSADELSHRLAAMYGRGFLKYELFQGKHLSISRAFFGFGLRQNRTLLLCETIGEVATQQQKEKFDILSSQHRFDFIRKRNEDKDKHADIVWDILADLCKPFTNIDGTKYVLESMYERNVFIFLTSPQETYVKCSITTPVGSEYKMRLDNENNFFIETHQGDLPFLEPPTIMVDAMQNYYKKMETWINIFLKKENKHKNH